ncbi:hypothetical protein GX50_00119 [[Emmonsia] crescens]|uniref:Uncharacterized protein n=1 Tax=[Emmonsia] crescens TaxID=73230 RepID=A0A2B7ZTW9_9EURO|nr:hypothetical protein GX50_00119 [Emmonsia crescens]
MMSSGAIASPECISVCKADYSPWLTALRTQIVRYSTRGARITCMDQAAVVAGNAKTEGGWKAARPEEAMPSDFVTLLGPADRQPPKGPTSSIKESFFHGYIWRSSVSSDSCASPNLYCRMASDLRSSKA